MRIRELKLGDMRELERIHRKFFATEFELPDFWNKFHISFVIDDMTYDRGRETILFGGVRPIAELVCVTNKDISVRKRVIALKEAVRAGIFACAVNQYDQLHCFIQGDTWKKQVETVGFRATRGQAMVIDVPS